LAFAALGGGHNAVAAGVYGLWSGVVAGIAAAVAIPFTRHEKAWFWCVISIATTMTVLILGFVIWARALSIACGDATGCGFG
jgi:hypothetical protein